MKEIPDAEKTTKDWDSLPDVVVLNVSFVNVVVCAKNGTSEEEIEQAVNREHPTGIDSRWTIDSDVKPEPCKDGRPDATHYLLSC